MLHDCCLFPKSLQLQWKKCCFRPHARAVDRLENCKMDVGIADDQVVELKIYFFGYFNFFMVNYLGSRLWLYQDGNEIWQYWNVSLDSSPFNWGLYSGTFLWYKRPIKLWMILSTIPWPLSPLRSRVKYVCFWSNVYTMNTSLLYFRIGTKQPWLSSMVTSLSVCLQILILLWLVWGTFHPWFFIVLWCSANFGIEFLSNQTHQPYHKSAKGPSK